MWGLYSDSATLCDPRYVNEACAITSKNKDIGTPKIGGHDTRRRDDQHGLERGRQFFRSIETAQWMPFFGNYGSNNSQT
eukprot:759319-Amphidinium_carterae.1